MQEEMNEVSGRLGLRKEPDGPDTEERDATEDETGKLSPHLPAPSGVRGVFTSVIYCSSLSTTV